MKTPCLHVGMVKTGTTVLQTHLFAQHPEIEFLGLFGHSYRDQRLQGLADMLRGCSPEPYDAVRCRTLYSEAVAPFLTSNRVVVLSDERLTSRVVRPPAGEVEVIPGVDHAVVAHRLHDLFGSWKIIMTIRNQLDLLWSWYLHDCRNSSIRADRWLTNHVDVGPSGPLGALEYFEMADRYGALFGADRVGIFAFEEMVRDPKAFARRFATFIGVDGEAVGRLLADKLENVRVSRRMMFYRQLSQGVFPNANLHRFLPEPVRKAAYSFLRRGKPTRTTPPHDWHRRVSELYRESNRRLHDAWRLPLDVFGYPL